MNNLKKLLLGFCVCLMAACSPSVERFQDTAGKVYQFNQLHGKWVILSYWADWCHTCRKEIRHLNAFSKRVATEPVIVLGVNFDHLDRSVLTKTIKEIGIQYPVLTTDPANVLNLGEVPGLPLTVVINPSGDVVDKLYGEQTEASLLKRIPPLSPSTKQA